jgi:hypothetical protein
VNARSFRSASALQHWTRLLVLVAPLVLFGVFTHLEHFAHARTALAQIPESCSQDVPLTSLQSVQCDGFWKEAVIPLFFAMIPFALVSALAFWLRRGQKAFCLHAQQRIQSPLGAQKAQFRTVAVRDDFFSWLYCLKSAEVVFGGRRNRVYLSRDALSQCVPGSEVQVFEMGRYLGKPRWVAVPEKPATHRAKIFQEVA